MRLFAAAMPLRQLWAQPNLRWLAITQFLTQITLYSTVIVAFQSSRGLSMAEMFLLESLLSAVIFLFEVPTGVLADRLGYLGLATAGQPGPTALLVGLVIAGGAWRQPVISAELNRRIPDSARATTLSALSFLAMVMGMGLNPLIGWAGDHGLGVAATGLGAGLLLLALVAPLLGRR